jgi:hypothetical protein
MGAKHTPGPWSANEYLPGDCWHISYGKRGNWIAEVAVDGDQKGAAADARLIASAPDLLEALQSLLDILAEGFISETHIDAARAAIAKATGEA